MISVGAGNGGISVGLDANAKAAPMQTQVHLLKGVVRVSMV